MTQPSPNGIIEQAEQSSYATGQMIRAYWNALTNESETFQPVPNDVALVLTCDYLVELFKRSRGTRNG